MAWTSVPSVGTFFRNEPFDLGLRGAQAMSIISWIILGVIAGYLGSKIMGRGSEGMLKEIALGIFGAVVGGLIFNLFGAQGITGLNLYSMIVSVVGAVVVIWAYHAITGRSI